MVFAGLQFILLYRYKLKVGIVIIKVCETTIFILTKFMVYGCVIT